MGLGVDESAELNDELLETHEIKLLSLSLVEQLHVEISHQILDFVFICKKEQFEVLEELDEFNHTEGFKSFLVILEVDIRFDGILAAGIFEEKRAKDSMVLFEEILDVLNITNLH